MLNLMAHTDTHTSHDSNRQLKPSKQSIKLIEKTRPWQRQKYSHSVLKEPIDANRKVNIDVQLGSHFSPFFPCFLFLLLISHSFAVASSFFYLFCPAFLSVSLCFLLVDSFHSLCYYKSSVCVFSDVHIVCSIQLIDLLITSLLNKTLILDSHKNFMSFPKGD